MRAKILAAVLEALMSQLTPEVVKELIDDLLDKVEDHVAATETKLDDMTVGQAISLARTIYDIPDDVGGDLD